MKNVEDIYPLSPVQEGMLFHTVKEPGSGVYVEQYCCRLSGNLDIDRFRQAWEKTVERFSSLRTAFLWDGVDSPLQIVRRETPFTWNEEDWRNLSKDEQQVQLDTFLAADREKGFELEKAPLLRFSLFQTGDESFQFIWSFHHLISDGWSTPLILSDMWAYYDAIIKNTEGKLPEVRPYRDYIAWLQEQDHTSAETFWKAQFRGFTPSSILQNIETRAPEQGHGELSVKIPANLLQALHTVARSNRLTLNTLVQGAWALLLSSYSGAKDIVFGETVAGRPASMENADKMVGLFINTLPVRIPVAGEMSVLDWLKSIQERQFGTRNYEHTPLVDVRRWAGVPYDQHFFESILVFENYPKMQDGGLNPGDLKIDNIKYLEQSNYPLAILVIPDDELQLMVIFDKSRFDSETAQRILEHFEHVLSSFVEDLNRPLRNVPLLRDAEVRQLVTEWNQTQADFPRESMIHELIEAQAEKTPENIAVVYKDDAITYRELNQRANQLAHYIRKQNGSSDDLVGILMDRSIEMIVAILGVLKSGAAYIPIDPEYPEARIQHMISDSQSQLLVSTSIILNRDLSALNLQTAIINIDSDWLEIARESSANPDRVGDSKDLAYLIYTSGSTGKPKGVMITHRNLVHSTHARFSYYEKPLRSFLLLSSFSFDSSVVGIFWTLCKGGALCIPDRELYKDVSYLGDLVRHHQISHLLCIPSLYKLLLKENDGKLKSLTTAIVAGEACPLELVEQHTTALPQCELFNEYGPTEGTVWASVFHCRETAASGSVPIGKPIENISLYVLDEQRKPVPAGVPGELYIGGEGVARGYLNQADLTDARFVENPFASQESDGEARLYKTGDLVRYLSDGNLEFLGRIDHQVKIRGYRIELEEIESALKTHPSIQEAVVVTVSQGRSREGERQFSSLNSPEDIAEQLLELGEEIANQLLEEVEAETNGATAEAVAPVDEDAAENYPAELEKSARNGKLTRQHSHADFDILLNIKHDQFICPPRTAQREWLVNQVVSEFRDDLLHLDKVSKEFVPGKDESLQSYDISESKLTDQQVMEDWQTPIMKKMAEFVTESHGDVLEIGFGRGVSAGFIQARGVKSHTIIESNPKVVEQYYVPWMKQFAEKDINLVFGKWQEVQDRLETYDGLFFHAFPLNEQEFLEYVINSITFAEHFFPIAANLLKKGGVFSYLTTEIDSLSRRHQRALFEHFSLLTLSIEPLSVPEDTQDTWWANSMVVVKAIK